MVITQEKYKDVPQTVFFFEDQSIFTGVGVDFGSRDAFIVPRTEGVQMS